MKLAPSQPPAPTFQKLDAWILNHTKSSLSSSPPPFPLGRSLLFSSFQNIFPCHHPPPWHPPPIPSHHPIPPSHPTHLAPTRVSWQHPLTEADSNGTAASCRCNISAWPTARALNEPSWRNKNTLFWRVESYQKLVSTNIISKWMHLDLEFFWKVLV